VKKLLFISVAFAVATSLVALAQETAKAAQAKLETAKAEKALTKAVMVTGKVSADAKTFVDKDNKSWTVTNPEALKRHEGLDVILKAHVDAAKNEIHVVSVKMGKEEMKGARRRRTSSSATAARKERAKWRNIRPKSNLLTS
jgi:hypothetical protein